MRTVISGLAFALTLLITAPAHAAETDWTKVDAARCKAKSTATAFPAPTCR